MVPLTWLSPEEAEYLGYKKSINHQNAIDRIRFNEPLINFTISNTRKDRPAYFNSLMIRIENPVLRLRICLYNVLLVCLSHMPIFVALIVSVSELSFIGYIFYTVCKYKYLENWFSIASRINVSFAILAINFIALIIGFTQSREISGFKDVSPILQYFGVAVIVFCVVFEAIFLITMIVVKVSRAIIGKFCTKKKEGEAK